MANIIVYFSRKDNNYLSGTIKDLKKGNTEIAAEVLQSITGGDLFEVEAEREYSPDYSECMKETKAEYDGKVRVPVKKYADLSKYDTVYVGYPNWWGTMPMAMFTFLEHYDLAGKKIIPFCTNEGSGLGSSEADLKAICKGAEVLPGISVHGTHAAESKPVLENWLKRILG